jgi:signal peptidase I
MFRHPRLPIMGPKRVIGLPGETIEFRENRVIVDGRELPLKALALGESTRLTPSIASDLMYSWRTVTG